MTQDKAVSSSISSIVSEYQAQLKAEQAPLNEREFIGIMAGGDSIGITIFFSFIYLYFFSFIIIHFIFFYFIS